MNLINWQQFGLKKNPYDTLPLVEGGDLPLNKVFVGRENEIKFLNGLFGSNDKVCLAICGDVGVGKTSLANFHKIIWKYEKEKLLFSFRREIEANKSMLDKKSFLIEIIGSVLREIKLLDPDLLKNNLLKKLSQIVDISQTMTISGGISILGCGGDFGGGKTSTPPLSISAAFLEECFTDLIKLIKNENILGRRYSGLIVHVNNFDVVMAMDGGKKMAVDFFNEIRDLLQTPNVYFIFLGPKNLFKDVIGANQRVKSIFYQSPLQITPLTKTEIVMAFNERMKLLKSDGVSNYIKPIEDEVIFKLYDLYNGDIRSIMAGIIDILGQYSERLAKQLTVNEAMILLGEERWDRIEKSMKLTAEQKQILKYLASSDSFISQKEIAVMFKKAQSNVSGYYFKPLKENGIIEEKERKIKTPYFGLTTDYLPLKWLLTGRDNIEKEICEKKEQLSFFNLKSR